jgi:DNA-binding GntR family transcriptional regulator
MDTSTPKYERAYRSVLDQIKGGRYPVGARIPTEGELSARFGVSRVTVRRALDMLVQDGYLESRQGSGYRVVTLSPASDTCLTSFTDAMLRAGHEPTTELLGIEVLPPGHPELASLPPDLRMRGVTRIRRLRRVDGEPRMLVLTCAPTDLLPGAAPGDFPDSGPGQSILRILSGRFGLDWSAACEDISPVLADGDMAALFSIAPGTPILRQACSAFGDDGSVVFHEDVFRTGAVSFALTRQARIPQY